ncbi:MBL fold metallo-hydrolase [Pantanalinema sp. GBBB05]|uniref:MBL fold metallo-hydrolase n=1 Tax=Pantanalinema sp. GBBB05 TaxID=2604139 RepID=UPI001D898E83|nr:MBL fold metallo-hydrolase [Pantanalinema sp. GBBB05]
MKRRQFVRYAGAGALTSLGLGFTSELFPAQAQAGGLSVQWLGHTCFLFSGAGKRILVNPFRSLGCTSGYRPPKVAADLVMISSQLLDEGAVEILPGNPRLLYEPGVYQLSGTQIEGIRTDHDLLGGKRFGVNVVWKWQQGGINILHMGGAAAPITVEQKILMGRPDLLLIPVGGGPKAYDPQAAKQAIDILQPKVIVPTQYLTQGANKDRARCDLVAVDNFLSVMGGTPVRRVGNSISLSSRDLPANGMVINVMSYSF